MWWRDSINIMMGVRVCGTVGGGLTKGCVGSDRGK